MLMEGLVFFFSITYEIIKTVTKLLNITFNMLSSVIFHKRNFYNSTPENYSLMTTLLFRCMYMYSNLCNASVEN